MEEIQRIDNQIFIFKWWTLNSRWKEGILCTYFQVLSLYSFQFFVIVLICLLMFRIDLKIFWKITNCPLRLFLPYMGFKKSPNSILFHLSIIFKRGDFPLNLDNFFHIKASTSLWRPTLHQNLCLTPPWP